MPKYKVEITVKPKSDKRKKRKSPPRPLIRTGDSPDVLSRRTNPGIRLFDLGQRRSSSGWESIDVQIAPTLDGGTGIDDPSIRAVQLSDYQAVDNDFLGTTGNWTGIFRQITKGGLDANSRISASAPSFGSGLLTALPATVWTSGGLKVTSSDLTAGVQIQNSNGFVEPVTLIDNGTYKITALPDFAASSVAFTPTKRMDVFLVPALILPYAEDGYINALGNIFAETAGFFYTTIFRPSIFDSGDAHYRAFHPPLGSSPETLWEIFYYWILYLKSQSNAKAGRLTINVPDFWTVISMASVATTLPFPAPPARPRTNPPDGGGVVPRYDNGTTGLGPYVISFGVQAAEDVAGSLVAVVQKGNQKYYFWAP